MEVLVERELRQPYWTFYSMVENLNSVGFGGDFVDKGTEKDQISLIKEAVNRGVNVIDTAEIYSKGRSETVIGKAIKEVRSDVFLSTKFSPNNSSFESVMTSCENSLRRLNTDYIDLYQVHWPYPNSNEQIAKAFKLLKKQGKILNFGVCNYSKDQLIEINTFLESQRVFSNQIEYNLFDRYIEGDILNYCEKQNIKILAYSPLNKCRQILDNEVVQGLSNKYRKTPAQIALNWLTKKQSVIALPKTNSIRNLILNIESNKFTLDEKDYQLLEAEKHNVRYISPDKIIVSTSGEGNRKVYTTMSEAVRNKLNFSPSPKQLSEMLGTKVKPVRLTYDQKEDLYYLVEGRVRYWAWVIKNGFEKKIPSLIYNKKL